MDKKYGYRIEPAELRDINNICVLCWGLLGDVLLRIPVIEALARRFPAAQITVIVDPLSAGLIEHHPDIHEVIAFRRSKRPLFRYVMEFLRRILYLRSRKFDLSVNLYSGGSSPLVTRLVNARIRLGFDHTPALRKANNLLVKKPSFCGNWTKALGLTLEPLGISSSEIRRGSSFYYPQAARQFAAGFLAEEGHCYVAVNLGAGVPEKRWPVERFVLLAEKIAEQYGLAPLVFTNPGMEELADEFVAQYRGLIPCKQVPLVSLDRIGALLDQVFAFITGDTSLMHLAFGVKCPNLVLFTHTRPEVVEPEDCVHIPCFVADESSLDPCGLPHGSRNIPVELALRRFAVLHKRLAHIGLSQNQCTA